MFRCFLEGRGACLIFMLVLLAFFAEKGFSLSHKILRDYPIELLENSMSWQIDMGSDWTFASTEDGLIQFDGSRPTLFPLNNRLPARSVNVNSEEGKVFVGGINEFGFFYPSPTESLVYVCLSDSVGADRYIGNIWGVYPEDGLLRVQGDTSIIIYDTHSGKYEVVRTDRKLDCSAWINGVLWLGTDKGLAFLMGKNIADVPGAEALQGKRIRKILDHGDSMIIVTSDGVWNYSNQKLSRLDTADSLIRQLGEIFSADLYENQLALGSVGNGFGLLDLQTGKTEIYDEANGLKSNTVISLKFDRRGDLWAGLQFGLQKVLLTLPMERLDNTSLPIGSGYVMARRNNNLFLGTNRGLFIMDYDTYGNLDKSTVRRLDGLSGQVWGLSEIDNELFCCHDHGLYLISDNLSVKRIGDISGVWDVQKLSGSPDKLLVGTYFGLRTMHKENGSWVMDNPIEGYEASTYNFVQESPGVIWTDDGEGGINRLTMDSLASKVNDVRNFKFADDGLPLTADIFISKIDNDVYFSTPKGLYVFDKGSEKIIKDREISRLLGFPKEVRRVKKVNGSIFALTPNEILAADPAGILDIKRLPISLTTGKPMHDKDVFFPLDLDFLGYPIRKGYLFFDFSPTSNSRYRSYPPFARINNVKVTSRGDSIIYRGNFNDIKKETILTYDENSVKIEFGSLQAVDRGILYSTRLNNEEWSNQLPLLAKEYTDLKEGDYVFEVKASSPDGEEITDSFAFKVLPPWWRSAWMKAGYILIIIALVFLMLWLEHRRVRKKELKLMLQKDEELAVTQEEHRKETEEKDRQIMQLEREKLDKELRHKAQEVANVMMSLSHKNETLHTVKKELQDIMNLVPRSSSDIRRAIQNLQGKVSVDIRSDEVLKRVEEEFDIVHDNFMKRLRAKFPELNNNEVLLCAYLKMNLSTKEIAPLLNISTRGVETMRYRLRKKFKLDRDSGLIEFLTRNDFN